MPLVTVILAGGTGTRLWPASSASSPKQFLKLRSKFSLLQQAILRANVISSELIVVVTTEEQIESVVDQSMALTSATDSVPLYVLTEPERRNTAPAIALSAHFVTQISDFRDEDINLLVLPSDHLITPDKSFKNDINSAEKLTNKGWLTAFGITPNHAETAYGYLELGETLETGHRVGKFHEKPDLPTASYFLESGRYLWNAGILFSRLDLLLAELQKYAPNITSPLADVVQTPLEINPRLTVVPANTDLRNIYRQIDNISFDYALMEHSQKIAVIRASFNWSDIGNWDEVARILPSDPTVASIESQDNSVFSDLPVVLSGVDNLIVVVKNGSVLITQKGSAHLARDVINTVSTQRPDLL